MKVGEVLNGRYEVLDLAGQGAQGKVLRARDRQHDRTVALKVREVTPGADQQRLLAEARVLLSLEPHPGLPIVRDDFFLGDQHVMVMEWVDGETLSARVKREAGGLPPTVAVAYLNDVARALDHLHTHEPPILHLDIKPANMIVNAQGRVVVVDFGVSSSSSATGMGGTPGFRAPEVASSSGTSPAADIYSLAATAYYLLTGHPPERGAKDAFAGLPAAGVAERVIRRSLATDPDRRHPSARAMVADLRAWIGATLPSGVVTLLMTDVESSTRAWDEHPDAMAEALTRHDQLMSDAVGRHGGTLIKERGEGDSTFAVFARAADAAACAITAQRELERERWPTPTPLRVRMALHTGTPDLRAGDYYGPEVNRCARLRAIGHGGQILLSGACSQAIGEELPAGAEIIDHGGHRLRDLTQPEHVFQLAHGDLQRDFAPLSSLDSARNNLPVQPTTFIGRVDAVDEVGQALTEHRIVTLTGTGGVGKTRLALQTAADLIERFTDGVWLTELAGLTDPSLVPAEVARAMNITEEPGRSPIETLTARLAGASTLIVLDNCEHLVDACRDLADRLIAGAPGVRILTTSREALGARGELLWPVPPLPIPADDGAGLDTLADVEAIRLFVDRAALSKPTFDLTEDNAPSVADICRRLEGIPLAIELAAARVRHMTPLEIAERLDDLFRSAGPREPGDRRSTLAAAIGWSYDMLSPEEQRLFRRLSVFAGGFTLEAAEAVCGDEPTESAPTSTASD